MKKICLLLFCVMFVILTISLQDKSVNAEIIVRKDEYQELSQEFRSVWLSHFISDIPNYTTATEYKKNITNVLNSLEALNINTILFHMRTHNNALYDSTLNPKATYYKNVDFNEFDPITWMIDECHKRGMEFHAWLNPYRVSSLNATKTIDAVVKSYESYPLNPASDINNLLYSETMAILNPALPNVQNHIYKTIDEIMNKYDVDGIHFDDYFYISGIDDSKTLEQYNVNRLSVSDFRRSNIDKLIEELSKQIKEYNITNNKAIQFGISPTLAYKSVTTKYIGMPIYNENGDLVSPEGSYTPKSVYSHYSGSTLCDTKKWIDNEWIDYILPQVYGNFGFDGYNFDDIVWWWGLATKYKKTNLYVGVGSSCAKNLERGWTSGSDLAKILSYLYLNEEAKGTSYFNYSSLVSNTSVMQTFRTTNNDYYQSKVPSAEVQNLDYIPSKIVNNVRYEKNTQTNMFTLSWDKVDNSRGYIVWKVPRGKIVDTTLKKDMYAYIQDNSINITLDNNYSYYVSSVNKANKISNPVGLEDYDTLENVISYIDDISSYCKNGYNQKYEDYVNKVYAKYIFLNELDRKQVTNVSVLKSNISRIERYKKMVNTLEDYIREIDKHIIDDDILKMKLLVDCTITFESNQYLDFIENKKLISSFGPYEVQTKATITNGVDSYSLPVIFNIGELENNGKYIFYRNASGSMIKTDPQDYDGSFIGWDNKILLYEDYCMFLAKGNCVNLTSSTLPNFSYPSCGVVYNNITENSITINTKDIPVAYSENGFMIANNNDNIIRLASNSILDYETITLEANEFMFISKNLDAAIKDSPLGSIKSTYINNYFKLTTYDEYKESRKINEMIKKILLEDDINEVKKIYDMFNLLNDDKKNMVFYRNDLITYYNKLLLEITNKKNEVLDLFNGVDLSIYSSVNQTIISDLIVLYNSKLMNSGTITEITKVMNNFNNDIAKILTTEEEYSILLEDYKAKMLKSINLIEIEGIDKTIEEEFQNIVIETINNINECTTINDIDSVKKSFDLKVGELDLKNKRIKAINQVNSYVNDFITIEAQNEYEILLSNTVKNLEEAKDEKELDDIISEFYKNINNIVDEDNSIDIVPDKTDNKETDPIIDKQNGCNLFASILNTLLLLGIVFIIRVSKRKFFI